MSQQPPASAASAKGAERCCPNSSAPRRSVKVDSAWQKISAGTMTESLKLVSFNILEGLRPLNGLGLERRQFDRDRLDAAMTVVRELDPDILVLNEALFCRAHAGKTVDYGGLFSFPHETAQLYDGAWGNAILSRHPIARTDELRIHNRAGLRAVLATPIGIVNVASYHPHPLRHPANKALDFASMVAPVRGPLLLCGDLNAISPEDVVDRPRLIAAFRRFASNPEATVDQFLESGRQVFARLAELGLHDAIPTAGRRYSIPTDLISLDKSSGIRIDHILANAAIEVLGGEVVHSAASNRASDHHPVALEFRVKPE
jgi:endonuclease/exonuclease/phosphatase family metal-dependent hydrolase